jgi:hypothetical protein
MLRFTPDSADGRRRREAALKKAHTIGKERLREIALKGAQTLGKEGRRPASLKAAAKRTPEERSQAARQAAETRRKREAEKARAKPQARPGAAGPPTWARRRPALSSMHMTTVHGVVRRLASQVTIAPQAAVYSTNCEINPARKPLCVCRPATGTFVKPSEPPDNSNYDNRQS